MSIQHRVLLIVIHCLVATPVFPTHCTCAPILVVGNCMHTSWQRAISVPESLIFELCSTLSLTQILRFRPSHDFASALNQATCRSQWPLSFLFLLASTTRFIVSILHRLPDYYELLRIQIQGPLESIQKLLPKTSWNEIVRFPPPGGLELATLTHRALYSQKYSKWMVFRLCEMSIWHGQWMERDHWSGHC
jgi:hypothetical protein